MAARGGLLKLLDAYIAIGGDAADFDKVVDQSEAKAKAAGGRLESAFSPRKVLGALGAAAGAVLGVAMTGANQLDAAMRQLQADTGMTDSAAKSAEHSMAGMYQNNLQGFAEIGASMAVVINGLDLTGAAADAMTEKFLKFETATGQGADAVSAFHEILNAWDLDASAVPHLMDLLVASHQKYGSSIADNQASLQRLAPQMKAMNMTIDDTVNLLNLFDAAGLDASKAQFALNTAVKNLKPGQTFNDLIAQVTAIEDPTLRAQEAIKLFGARGGVGLANALKPGITSLSDFATSVTDTAGATDKAAAAVESGFVNQATLWIRKLAGPLADFGTQFGPLLMVAATIGPKFTTALLSGLGGLGGLFGPKLLALILPEGVAAGMTAGAATGTAFGIAIGPAIALAIPAAIIIGLEAAKPTIQKWLDDVGLHVPNLFEGQGALAPTAGIQPVGPQGLTPEQQKQIAADYVAGIAKATPDVASAGATLGAAAWAGFAGAGLAGIATASKLLRVAADQAYAVFGGSMAAVLKAMSLTGADGMEAMAKGIQDARQKPVDAFTSLVDMLKNAMSPAKEAARLAGELTSKELAAGLRSADPAVRAQAIAVREEILSRLGALRDSTGSIGKAAMDQLRAGMKSKDPLIRQTAHDSMVVLMTGLADRASQATPAGRAAMDALIQGTKDKDPDIRAAALAAMKVATDSLASGTTAARNAGQLVGAAYAAALGASAWAGFRGAGLPGIAAPAPAPAPAPKPAPKGPIRAFALGTPYVPFDQLALVHRGEIVVPAAQSDAIRSGQATLGAAGDTFSPTVNVSVNAGSDVSPGAARRFGQAVADEVANVLQEQNARFTSRLRVARA
jgi:Phage-related minor tail protein